jgi:hypothetical protein
MKQKFTFTLLLVGALGFAVTYAWVNNQRATRQAHEYQAQRAAWEVEKANLQTALDESLARVPQVTRVSLPGALITTMKAPDARELVAKLAAFQGTTGFDQNRALRQVVGILGQLVEIGPAALPAIQEFLATDKDVVFAPADGKGPRDIKTLTDALVPASLRFGLFDVVRQIGGDEAGTILAGALEHTGRGIEVAYLTQLLEEMSPGQFRDAALNAARTLLASASGDERNYLFDVLKRFGDTSYVSTAQAQLVQANGQIDRAALRYLQQTLGDKSITLAAQTYQDARVTDADSKESLARLALAYVGNSDQAVELFHAAVLDPTLKPDQRRELVEDLNQDGLSSKKNFSPADLKVIARRYELTQAYLQQDYVLADQTLNAAFHEADKDLAKMLQRGLTPAKTSP